MKTTLVIIGFALGAICMQSCTSITAHSKDEIANPSLQTELRKAQPDTITSLDKQTDSVAYFKAPNGKIYLATLSKRDSNEPITELANPLYCVTDSFLGIKRKNSKTSYAVATTKSYKNVAKLKASLLADSVMRKLSPAIKSDSASIRVTAEIKNVKIKTAYIYAVSREDDNDFHIIIGDSLPYDASKSISIEISGLPKPPNNNSNGIQKVRTKFENFFGEKCSGTYTIFSPPIKITVSGSLFFDIDHGAGIIGTGIYKPNSCWEIHPVSAITFK